MKQVYPVIFTITNENVLVEVPDLSILTEGADLANAVEMARDAIGIKGISMEDAGIKIPDASDMKKIDMSAAAFVGDGESILSLVDVDFTIYRRRMDNKTVRRNVTLPNWLNLEAEKAQINVSRVLQEALMLKLGITKL